MLISQMHLLRSYTQYSPVQRRTLLAVVMLQILVHTGLALLPFGLLRKVLFRLSTPGQPAPGDPEDYVTRMRWAMQTSVKYLLPRSSCLTQAMTVKFLLRRRGIAVDLHIGVLKESEDQLKTHAWVTRNGYIVIGGTPLEIGKYTLLTILQ